MERFNFKIKQFIYVCIALLIILFVIVGVKNAKLFYPFFIVKEIVNEERTNEIMQELVSPSGEYVAYIFKNSAGATTGWSYHLSVFENGQSLNNESGNTYISYSPFLVKWTGNRSLLVTNNNPKNIFKQETRVNGVQIKYMPMDEDE